MRRIVVGGARNIKLLVAVGLLVVVTTITACTSPVELPVSSQPAVSEKSAVVSVNPATPVVPTAPTVATISWTQAANHIGKTVIVCGPVTGIHWANTSKGKPTFINVGKPYPDPNRFTVIIWGNNRANFSQSPEKYYEGKNICVTGLIIQYNGMAEVEIKSPDQITVR